MTHDRRRFSAQDIEAIGAILDYKLEDRLGFRKNGHTWTQWLWKVFTPERIIWSSFVVIGAVYSFGGDIRDARKQLQEAASRAAIASAKADEAATKAAEAAAKNVQLTDQVSALQQEISEGRRQQELFRSDVRSKLAVTPTRSEFNAAIEERIIPRLERIEKAQPK